MNSMKIGTYQMDTTFGLYLPEYTIPAPAVQTNFVKIIGRDGSVDLSNALGLHYDSRTWSLDFKCFDPTVNWHTLSSQVMNAIHGKRLNFEFDDDPNYFWTGRVSVQNYVSNHGTGTLKVTIVSDPFKYAKLSTIVTKTASTGTDYTGSMVTFNDGLIYDLSADIEPIQDLHGYSNPWPAGGGKNLFDIDGYLTDRSVSYTKNGDTYTITTATSLFVDPYIFSDTDEQVTISFGSFANGTTTNVRIDAINTNGTIVKTFSPNTGTQLVTANKIRFNWSNQGNFTISKLQIEKGSTATDWTPYSNICPITGRTGLSVYVSPTQDVADATTYAVDWTSEAGTVYGGTLDVVTGVLTVDRASVLFDGTQRIGLSNWRPNSSSVGWLYAPYSTPGLLNVEINSSNLQSCGFISDTLETVVYGGSSGIFDATKPCISLVGSSSWGVAMRVNDTTLTTNARINAYLSANPIRVVYKLATPLTYQLTAQEVEALVGTNNVWSDGGNVTVAVVTPETLTNNGRAVVPTLTASADMVLKWGNYSASVQQGTSTIPQLILENGANLVYIIGTGSISFTWQEASL